MGEVRNKAELNRFELEVEGHLAVAYYRPSPGVITFTHTEVPSELGGRGVAHSNSPARRGSRSRVAARSFPPI